MGSWKTGPRHYEDIETELCSVQVLVFIEINGVGREEKFLHPKKLVNLWRVVLFSVYVWVHVCGLVGVCVCVCVCVFV